MFAACVLDFWHGYEKGLSKCRLVQHLSTATAVGYLKVCSSCGLDAEYDICKAYVVAQLPQLQGKLTWEDVSSLRQQHAEQLFGIMMSQLGTVVQLQHELADKTSTVAKLQLVEAQLQQQLLDERVSLKSMRKYETITASIVKEVGPYAHKLGCPRCQFTWFMPSEHAAAMYSGVSCPKCKQDCRGVQSTTLCVGTGAIAGQPTFSFTL